MVQIDFSKIRGDLPDGQRGAFEELVCQLARREAPAVDAFRRIEGAGGDGGVECLVKSADGMVGYQAKFYTKPGEIDWSAIDNSVNTALKLHPNLVRYVIAVPCDFTGRRRTRGNKVSEGTWGIWDEHVAKWEAACATPVEFIPWTAAELSARATPTNAGGLRAYWFAQIEFSAEWFRQRVEGAIAALDDRYHPEDHVDVHLEQVFDIMVRHPRAIATVEATFLDVRRARLPRFSVASQPPLELIAATEDALARALECEAELRQPVWQPWNTSRWLDSVWNARHHLSEVLDWQRKRPEPYDHDWHQLQKLDNALYSLELSLGHSFNSVESTRSALFDGTAGSGKSHLLARVAETCVAEGRPVILWLGQQLRDQALWPQLLQRLGLTTTSPDEFLGAIDSAAESAHTRALLLVDALNEGAGAKLWRAEIAEFLQQLHRYPNIAIALTCRSEYVEYLVPSGLLKSLERIQVRGFETQEEQAAAARVYLDKRGIARPATPWLSPEFVNPLFLRSCCNALEREGLREFPKGLTGTKAILSFYLESVAKHLDETRSGSQDLVAPTKSTLAALARSMGTTRRNYVSLKEATEIATDSFQPYPAPNALTWLDALRRNGLLRLDPDPDFKANDPLAVTADVVRFSFQRFQDHLMAEVLLADVPDVEAAFADGGSLAFVRTESRFQWEWRGLVEALSIQIPERAKQEFVDTLPGGVKRWWSVPFTQEAFLESIRWRSPGAFTDRTLALFNRVLGSGHEPLSHLIELSASIDHPWNARLIHRNLKRRPIHRRDAFWTARLNSECGDEQHSVHRLIDWCLRPEVFAADSRTILLCAITLSWLFTLSSRPVRDRATKALAHVLVGHPAVLSELIAEFKDVDDLYVLERIFAAAFGAACTDPNPDRVRTYAQLAATTLFLGPSVPANLVLRDCGRGLVELAVERGVLPADIALERCHPPYVSPAPRFTATEAQVERLAEQAGDKAILFSSAKWGDFGRYEIEPVLRHFTAHRLTKTVVPTPQARFAAFERDVVGTFSDRRIALDKLRSVIASGIRIVFFGSSTADPTPEEEKQRAQEIEAAEQAFVALLNDEERIRYRQDARGHLGLETRRRREEHPRIDVERAQFWVAKRAYEIGRASSRLPWSHRSMEPDRGRPHVERLGKKYQWIALDELTCRLADNYWIAEYGDETRRYEYPPDVGFFRDVDPTIIAQEARESAIPWMSAPSIVVEPAEADRLTWPFTIDRGPEVERLIRRTDDAGRSWVTVYEHQHASERNRAQRPDSFRLFGREEFRFVCLVLVHRTDRDDLVESINKTRNVDIHSWDPPEFTDGPYLLEAPWRQTWKAETWMNDNWRGRSVPVAFPISEYMWESHLDLSLTDGHREFLPSPWLMRRLGLSRRRGARGKYDDSSGVTRMLQGPSGHDGSVALLDHDWFTRYLKEESLECVWVYLNERNSFLDDEHGAWRRTEGIAWIEGDQARYHTWHDDRTRRGDSE